MGPKRIKRGRWQEAPALPTFSLPPCLLAPGVAGTGDAQPQIAPRNALGSGSAAQNAQPGADQQQRFPAAVGAEASDAAPAPAPAPPAQPEEAMLSDGDDGYWEFGGSQHYGSPESGAEAPQLEGDRYAPAAPMQLPEIDPAAACRAPDAVHLPSFSQAAISPLLWVSQDRSEGVWLWVHEPRAGRSKVFYGFVSLRFVRFQDKTELVGWCRNCLCGAQSCRNARLFSGQDRSNLPASWMGNSAALCPSAQHAVTSLGGPRAVRRRLHLCAEGDAVWEGRVRDGHTPCTAVRASDAFDDWGVLDRSARCTTCSSDYYNCKHAEELSRLAEGGAAAGAGSRTPVLTQAEWLGQLKPYLGPTGEVPITSISQQQLPEDLEGDPELLATCQARSEGRARVPASCPPTQHELLTIACPQCRSPNCWEAEPSQPAAPKCRVFLPAAVAWTSFPQHKCTHLLPDGQRCDGLLSTDGRSYGILRHSPALAYAHELMYQWSSRMANRGIAWYTMWRDIVDDIKGLSVEEKRKILNLSLHFQRATIEFVHLQRIDFHAGFRCPNGARYLTADGISVGFKAAKARVHRPWVAPVGAVAVAGSLFQDRVMVPDAKARELLHRFSKPADGVTLEELESLEENLVQLGQHGAAPRGNSLVPFLSDNRVTVTGSRYSAPPHQQGLLRSLSTQAPACQVLPPTLERVAEDLANSVCLSLESEDQLAVASPVLYDFIKGTGSSQADCRHLATFIRQLLEASRGAFPADAGVTAAAAAGTRAADRGDQPRPPPPQDPAEPADKPAIECTREESFHRQAIWSGMGPAHWQPSHRGGSHVYRDLHNYVADSHTLSTSQDHEPTCSKAQRTTRLLVPGLMIIWCACCGKAVLFSLMTDSESPRTIFELLYTHCPEAPTRFQFDNGCNVHRYALHREPSFFKFTQFLVDQLHFAGHKNCSLAYSTEKHPDIANSSLAEQKNSAIRHIEGQSAYMTQPTFLVYTRYFLYLLNKEESKRRSNTSWVHRGYARRS